ncbi:unnamed protein product [marine sediment metagenome]|uniref:Uncharacterized protein n=1 Tax=marine sediment metagenome TaxID=412755 RepID=X1P2S7_9ZZZZ
MPGLPQDGGKRLQHRVVELDIADGVTPILEANPARLRCLIFNANTIGTGSIVAIGSRVDFDGGALDATNGWLLLDGIDQTVDKPSEFANVVELFTKDTVYGLTDTDATPIKILEELLA